MSEKKSFVLRLDKKTYDALEQWAVEEYRSVNGQLEYIINKALKEIKSRDESNQSNREVKT